MTRKKNVRETAHDVPNRNEINRLLRTTKRKPAEIEAKLREIMAEVQDHISARFDGRVQVLVGTHDDPMDDPRVRKMMASGNVAGIIHQRMSDASPDAPDDAPETKYQA